MIKDKIHDRESIKSAKRATRRARWRCYWTRPIGHDDSLLYNGIRICCYCGHPVAYLCMTMPQKVALWEAALAFQKKERII